MHDTTPAARQFQADVIRSLEPITRMKQALELSESVRAFALARLRKEHPALTDLQLVERLINAPLIPARPTGPAA